VARLPGRHVSYPLNFAILVSKIVGSLQNQEMPTASTNEPCCLMDLLRTGNYGL
jgi:hypothetical protein